MSKKKNDMVNHPSHYTTGGLEVLEVIERKLGHEQYKGYLKGNILKYLLRFEYKNGLEDLQKADFYLKRLITLCTTTTK